jgi:tol-pal system-associated acyl-CoA thioesterase
MEKRIYYHDTDCGGVVYYGNYLKYMEESRTEFLEKNGLTLKELKERNFLYAVRTCNISYKAPARYGDTIICEASLVKVTAVQMLFAQTITNKETGKLLVEAEVGLVCLTPEFKPTAIPESIKTLLNVE